MNNRDKFKSIPSNIHEDIMKHSKFITLDEIKNVDFFDIFFCVVLIKKINEVITSKNHVAMAFVDVEDLTGKQEVIIFPPIYKIYKYLLQEEKMLCLKCMRDVTEKDINSVNLHKNKVVVLAIESLATK